MTALRIAGAVVSLHIAPHGAAPMQSVASLNAIAGRGLEGDRYYLGSGTYSQYPGDGRQVTLIEIDAISALGRDYGIALESGSTRRNVVTRGLALNHLVGKQFKIGSVDLRGTRLCEPCTHLERLSNPGALRGLIHRAACVRRLSLAERFEFVTKFSYWKVKAPP